MRKDNNVRQSCDLIKLCTKRICDSMKKQKKLPVEMYISIVMSVRMIDAEVHRIKRTTWRSKKEVNKGAWV